jgi:hypothetical protein
VYWGVDSLAPTQIRIDASLTNARWLAVCHIESQHADIDGAATWCCLLLRVERTCWPGPVTSEFDLQRTSKIGQYASSAPGHGGLPNVAPREKLLHFRSAHG